MFDKRGKRYTVTKLELLAIVYAVSKFRIYELCSENNGNFRFMKKIFIYLSRVMLSPSK